jgi:hypothetical protein
MKLTKEKLQQIIKEELENLVNEEEAIDYAKRQEGYEDKIYSMLVRKDAHKDPETARKIRTDKEMMYYLTMVLIKAHDPMNKRDPDYKTKASVAVEKAFDNVIKNIESGEYAKKPDVPPESPEAKREREIAFGQAMARGDYGKLD